MGRAMSCRADWDLGDGLEFIWRMDKFLTRWEYAIGNPLTEDVIGRHRKVKWQLKNEVGCMGAVPHRSYVRNVRWDKKMEW